MNRPAEISLTHTRTITSGRKAAAEFYSLEVGGTFADVELSFDDLITIRDLISGIAAGRAEQVRKEADDDLG